MSPLRPGYRSNSEVESQGLKLLFFRLPGAQRVVFQSPRGSEQCVLVSQGHRAPAAMGLGVEPEWGLKRGSPGVSGAPGSLGEPEVVCVYVYPENGVRGGDEWCPRARSWSSGV